MLRCNWPTALASALLFALPYAVLVFSAGLLLESDVSRAALTVIAYASIPVIVALICVGYVSARLAGASGVANGVAVGLLLSGVLLAGPYLLFSFDTHLLEYVSVYGPHALVMGVFWCSLGGLIRELMKASRAI